MWVEKYETKPCLRDLGFNNIYTGLPTKHETVVFVTIMVPCSCKLVSSFVIILKYNLYTMLKVNIQCLPLNVVGRH